MKRRSLPALAIQDLNSAVAGELDVRVQEQDGSVQEYKVNTANIPYLTRRAAFVTSFTQVNLWPTITRRMVTPSEPLSFLGISNGWSLYGGMVSSSKYISLAAGIGRDLMALGALAFDVTRSDAKLEDEHRSGQSYRVSYSKRFDDTGSQ